jgi:predicted DCC family thiol-disulfide oxidoreductase YuxK
MTRKLRVFFDGGCPMCRKEISVYKEADKAGAISWCDVSTDQREVPLPLPRDVLLARFHVQTPDGQLISGAGGFIEMWRQLPKWRWLAMICSLPGLPTILELAYRGFLRVRPAIQQVFR